MAKHYYKADFDLQGFQQQTRMLREAACETTDSEATARIIRQILATLNSSHTTYHAKHSPKRHQMLGIFHATAFQDLPDSEFIYDGIGIDTRQDDTDVIITSVYDGFPAAAAGLRFGDRIIAVDNQDFQLGQSFRGRAGTEVLLKIRHGQDTLEIPVQVEPIDARTMFETALKASFKIIDHNGMKVAYAHVWSYAGQKYQDMLKTELLWGELSKADALILDLRDGYGGASPDYVNLFREPVATMVGIDREGNRQHYTGVWGKPVNILINGGSTSGKELFAYTFKKLQLGKLVGETTAGAVLAGRIFLLDNGAVLYLAVSDVLVDGQRLEGRGVAPDIRATAAAAHTNAKDQQTQAALNALIPPQEKN
ncbi:MAG: S41 family peptidase [Wenzhouxiangellaceae bacterium]